VLDLRQQAQRFGIIRTLLQEAHGLGFGVVELADFDQEIGKTRVSSTNGYISKSLRLGISTSPAGGGQLPIGLSYK